MTKRKISELKAMARLSLQGNFTTAAVSMVMVTVIAAMGNSLAVSLFGGTSLFALVMSQIFSIVVSLITSVFYAGIYYMFLNITRGKPANMGNVFHLFQHHPDRIIVVSLVFTGIEYVLTLPSLILTYRLPGITEDPVKTLGQLLLVAVVMLVGMAASVIVTMPITLSYYLLVDNEEMQALEAMRESVGLMKGNYGRYLHLVCSFIGLFLLGVCSCYIGFLWIAPYLQMAEMEFYRDIIGELDERKEPEALQEPERPVYTMNDDYNAEA